MKKGFTLIELLIVIGILAILATVVVLVLNPAEILAQARDSQRISDLGSVKSALALYLGTATNPVMGVTTSCTMAGCVTAFTAAQPALGPVGTSTITQVNGTGWVWVDLGQTAGGSPMSSLPIDPINSGSYYYLYAASSTKVFELDGRLESLKYRELMKSDGGDKGTCSGAYVDATCWYELGTAPGLAL